MERGEGIAFQRGICARGPSEERASGAWDPKGGKEASADGACRAGSAVGGCRRRPSQAIRRGARAAWGALLVAAGSGEPWAAVRPNYLTQG